MTAIVRPAAVILAIFTVLCGLLYPALVTAVAQAAFPRQANGSLVVKDGKVAGSSLIGQPFTDPAYFWGRPSGTAPFANNGSASSGTNLGPTNPALIEAVQARIDALRAVDPDNTAPVPIDLVTASASGLDPHISPAAARYQAGRVARLRGLTKDAIEKLVEKHTEGRLVGLLGEPRVHVLELNSELDVVAPRKPAEPTVVSSDQESRAP